MSLHLISDVHEWINEIPIKKIFHLFDSHHSALWESVMFLTALNLTCCLACCFHLTAFTLVSWWHTEMEANEDYTFWLYKEIKKGKPVLKWKGSIVALKDFFKKKIRCETKHDPKNSHMAAKGKWLHGCMVSLHEHTLFLRRRRRPHQEHGFVHA